MWVGLLMGLSVLVINWEDVTDRFKVVALITGLSIAFGGGMLIKNTTELSFIKKSEQDNPNYSEKTKTLLKELEDEFRNADKDLKL